jgi:hypothetical protein
MIEFREFGSSSKGVSSGAFLSGWATNAGTVGNSADDVSVLSTLDMVVQTLGSAADAFSPHMARTSWRF